MCLGFASEKSGDLWRVFCCLCVLIASTLFYVGYDLVHFCQSGNLPIFLTYLCVDWCTMSPLFVEGLFALLCFKCCDLLEAISTAAFSTQHAKLAAAFTRVCQIGWKINQRLITFRIQIKVSRKNNQYL